MNDDIFPTYYVDSIPQIHVNQFFDILRLVHRMIFVDRYNKDVDKPYMKNPTLNESLSNFTPSNIYDQDIKYSYVVDYDNIGASVTGRFKIELSLLRRSARGPYQTPLGLEIMDIIASETFWFMNTRLNIVFKEPMYPMSRMEKYFKVWFNIPKTSKSVSKFYESRTFIEHYYDSIPSCVRTKVHRLLLPGERLHIRRNNVEEFEKTVDQKRHQFLQLLDKFEYSLMITNEIKKDMYNVFYNPNEPISDANFF